MGGSLVVQAAVNQNLAEHAGGAPLWASMLSAFVSGRQLDALSSRGPLKVAGRCTIPWDTLVGLAGRTAGRIQRASASAPGRPPGEHTPLCGHHHRAVNLI